MKLTAKLSPKTLHKSSPVRSSLGLKGTLTFLYTWRKYILLLDVNALYAWYKYILYTWCLIAHLTMLEPLNSWGGSSVAGWVIRHFLFPGFVLVYATSPAPGLDPDLLDQPVGRIPQGTISGPGWARDWGWLSQTAARDWISPAVSQQGGKLPAFLPTGIRWPQGNRLETNDAEDRRMDHEKELKLQTLWSVQIS